MTRNPAPGSTPDLATPRPWLAITEGSFDQKHAAAKAFEAVMATKVPDCPACEFTDLTWLRDDTDAVQIALVGNGPKATENAALIVAAVNDYDRLRAIEAAARATKAEHDANGHREPCALCAALDPTPSEGASE